MSINSVQVTSGPDREGYHSLRHGRVYDGTNEADQKRSPNVPSSAAAEELIREIGHLVGGTPPDAARRAPGDDPDTLPPRTPDQTLAEIDATLQQIAKPSATDGARVIQFPTQTDLSQAA